MEHLLFFLLFKKKYKYKSLSCWNVFIPYFQLSLTRNHLSFLFFPFSPFLPFLFHKWYLQCAIHNRYIWYFCFLPSSSSSTSPAPFSSSGLIISTRDCDMNKMNTADDQSFSHLTLSCVGRTLLYPFSFSHKYYLPSISSLKRRKKKKGQYQEKS